MTAEECAGLLAGLLLVVVVQGLLFEVGLELNRRRVHRIILAAQQGVDEVRELLDQRAERPGQR